MNIVPPVIIFGCSILLVAVPIAYQHSDITLSVNRSTDMAGLMVQRSMLLNILLGLIMLSKDPCWRISKR
jgi:hypothetical protein